MEEQSASVGTQVEPGAVSNLQTGSQEAEGNQQEAMQSEATAVQKDHSKMVWSEGKAPPDSMVRGSATVHGNTAYFTLYDTYLVWCYHSTPGEERWSMLPENPCRGFGLTVIDGLLTSVGGFNFVDGWTCKLASLSREDLASLNRGGLAGLSREDGEQMWTHIFPPMACGRMYPACVTTDSVLVVAGGMRDSGWFRSGYLDSVEVMNVSTKQWTMVASLPRKQANLSAVLHGDTLYLAGGECDHTLSKSVFSCSLSALLDSNNALKSKIKRTVSPSERVWKEVTFLPMKGATLASFGGCVLGIGGYGGRGSLQSDVCVYDSHSDSWSVVFHVPTKLGRCFAVNLPGDCCVVVGPFIMFNVEV